MGVYIPDSDFDSYLTISDSFVQKLQLVYIYMCLWIVEDHFALFNTAYCDCSMSILLTTKLCFLLFFTHLVFILDKGYIFYFYEDSREKPCLI